MEIKELTCAQIDSTWWHYLVYLELTEEELIVCVPFRKYVLPLLQIEKLSSEQMLPQVVDKTFGVRIIPNITNKGLGLKITHHCNEVPQTICFISTKWKEWFEAFEKKGIDIEDKENLKNANTTILKWAKFLNLFFGILAIVVAASILSFIFR